MGPSHSYHLACVGQTLWTECWPWSSSVSSSAGMDMPACPTTPLQPPLPGHLPIQTPACTLAPTLTCSLQPRIPHAHPTAKRPHTPAGKHLCGGQTGQSPGVLGQGAG